MFQSARVLILSACIFGALSGTAHAYVDPGTGAFILQILAAFVAGGLFYFRRVRDKIKSLLRFRNQKN